MNNNTENIDQVIARVLSGEASSEDYFSLSRWLNESPKNQDEFALFKNYWEAEVSFSHIFLPEASADRVIQEIQKTGKERKRRKMRQWILPLAAAVALLFSISLSIYYQHRNASSVYYTYLSGDSKSEFYLEDSTKVILNKNSRLVYSDRYGEKIRSVELEGEAYFEVVKNPELPFEVNFGDAKISVLGTTFLAKGNRDCDQITATLLTGSIRFESPEQQVILVPNQKLNFTRSSNLIDVRFIDPEEETAWKDGVIRYKSIPLSQLVVKLSEYYQVKIVIKNRDLLDPSLVVSGSFDEKQSIEEVLHVVSKSLPIRFKETKGVYYIE
ncbi:FecR family protein [Parabacteroides sp. Marseille-P3160]|uniref:FecR family protein n=1 Tax=Parabacteroides sp. Marseille-P3160 TaxID=1917887 RepID=UPI0009BA52B1|nr:FecR domain-containing protein [Parabacteroides sp. Marseille-P3160]